MMSPDVARHAFEVLAIGGKLGLATAMLVLALVNCDASYVARKPRLFLLDAVFTGMAGACAALLLCCTRGRMDAVVVQAAFALLFFFVFAVCREFSGYFSLLSGEGLTPKEKTERKAAKKPVIYVAGACAVVAIAIAAIAHVAPPLAPLVFVIEMLAFATIVALSDLWCAYSHAQPMGSAFGIAIGLYSALHIVLQLGGVYESLYKR
jgi:hypothetical protein